MSQSNLAASASGQSSSPDAPFSAKQFGEQLDAEDAKIVEQMAGPMDAFLATLPAEDAPTLTKEQREYILKFRQLLKHQEESFKRKIADRHRAYDLKFNNLQAAVQSKR
jgi:hypothetical protein